MKNNLKNILLVEDDLNFGSVLNDFLNLHSYNVVLAKNGIEGLEKFKKNEFIFFLIYRFIGGIPFFISNILPTIFNVKVKNFFLGSIIGMTPQLFVGASLGAGLSKILKENSELPSVLELIFSPDIYLPILGIIILVIIGFLLKKNIYTK